MSTQTLQTKNPATEEQLNTFELLSKDEAFQKVEQCHKSFLDWRETPIAERAKLVKKLGEVLQKHKDSLADLMNREMGKLVEEGKQEVDLCSSICEYTAEHGPRELQDENHPLEGGGRALVTHQPIGVIFGIQPWNFPIYQVIRYTAPNLVAGNGVLLKHAENVWGMAQKLEELAQEAGLPEGIFLQLRIDHDVAESIIKHKRVRGVTFTGSSAAGRKIAKKAAKALKKTVLELGSNDAYIVLADADLEKTVEACSMGRFNNAGQTCVAAKRFVVVESVYEEFKKRFLAAAKDVETAPMARKDLREKLHEQVKESIQRGATCLLGGEVPDGSGFYYPATLLENVKPGMPAYDEELFGPVASLIKAKDADDAMRIANDSVFGLGGGIFSADKGKAIEMARKYFDTGMVNINSYNLAQPNLPFGGVKNSGYGREHGGHGIREFINTKTIMIG